ncbi:MAG: ACT domain-containing protein [Selenomonadaceae bacterium]|nr:ACT domain-containing protein [Selenomonadaceae bacterium]MBQ7630521.1 ACT domain-containing protein [Selenomonadaceae bacterium]
MSVNQVSVFLENKPGTLNKMTEVLAKSEINIRALSLADTNDFGIVRMIVNDVIAATNVLQDANFVATFTPVLIYTVSDKTGGLNELLKIFTESKVNIEYMYAFAGKKRAYMIFRVSDTKAAEKILTAKGLKSLSQEDIAEV